MNEKLLKIAEVAFAIKYPEFYSILELYREHSNAVSGIDAIVPKRALSHFQNGYTAGYIAGHNNAELEASTVPTGWTNVELEKPPLYTALLFYREDAGVFEGKLTELANEVSEQYIKEYEISVEAQFELDYFCYTAEGGLCRLEGSEVPTHWMPMPGGLNRPQTAPIPRKYA